MVMRRNMTEKRRCPNGIAWNRMRCSSVRTGGAEGRFRVTVEARRAGPGAAPCADGPWGPAGGTVSGSYRDMYVIADHFRSRPPRRPPSRMNRQAQRIRVWGV
ncbi:hypothetical protein GCM10027075_03490 [Streptomyces heilongjiangensis]